MKKEDFIADFKSIRQTTETLCASLSTEDYLIQSMPDVSPPKWHLAHTTWFFETFVLLKHDKTYQAFDPLFHYLFNSYYQTLGAAWPREQRGLLARPSIDKVYDFRHQVNQALLDFIDKSSDEKYAELVTILQLGLQHEQQHQELLLMDIKHNFSLDPSGPTYHALSQNTDRAAPLLWLDEAGGEADIGHHGKGFSFDNELSQHRALLSPWKMASRLVTNEEYAEFIDAKAYENPLWWLSDGWDYIQKNKLQAPLYWRKIDNQWHVFTLNGMQKLNPHEPLVHVSFYEADAYARFRHCRLPTEQEWEHHARQQRITGNFLESKKFHPQTATQKNNTQQVFGDVWEWTASAYLPYPGFQPLHGEVGEYNGKFMSNQMVLRGGACVTPQAHIRSTYRNFFQPDKRWAFTGVRLAKNA